MSEEVLSKNQFKRNYTHNARELRRTSTSLSRQGPSERLWAMADYHALQGNRNEEIEYREAAKLAAGHDGR
jgi:hypothetical protein